jgi:hypothetical protein
VQETKNKGSSILFVQKEGIWKGSVLIKAEKHLFSHLVQVEDKRRENSRWLVGRLSGDCVDCMR